MDALLVHTLHYNQQLVLYYTLLKNVVITKRYELVFADSYISLKCGYNMPMNELITISFPLEII